MNIVKSIVTIPVGVVVITAMCLKAVPDMMQDASYKLTDKIMK